MTTTFVGTSGPPTVPAFAVPRPDLVDRLDEALTRPVVLLVAPAGYGKSVLLGQWADRTPARKVAWVSISDLDNDGVHLGRNLCDAIGQVDPDAGELLRSSLRGSADSLGAIFLDQLLGELEAAGELTIVLDDLERLSAPSLQAELGQVAERLPPGSHLLLSCRHDPSMFLHRLRGRDELAELRQEALAMEAHHATELVRGLAGVTLRSDQAQTLVQRTEGWAAGLQLAALSLRGREDVDVFLADFSGNDRHVADYLSGEILADLDPDERDFLVATSVLDRLTGPACDAVTGRSDGGRMLEELDRRAIFVTAVEGRRDRYRSHALFRDLLRYELRTSRPDDEEALHARAAAWYREQGDTTSVAYHLLEGRDWEGVIDLAQAHGRDYYERGESNVVLGWMTRLPAELVRSRPDAALITAILQIMGGLVLAAEDLLDRTVREHRLSPPWAAVADMLRAQLVSYHLPPGEALAAARRVLDVVETVPPEAIPSLLHLTDADTLMVEAHYAAARAELIEGRMADARAWLDRADQLSRYPAWTVHLLGLRGQVEALAGRLQAAQEAASRALAVAAETGLSGHRSLADTELALAQVHRERREWDEAALHLAAGEREARVNRRHVLLAFHRVEHASLLLATGRLDQGLALVQAGPEEGAPPLPEGLEARFCAAEARLLAAAGRTDRALARIDGFTGPRTAEVAAAHAAVGVAAQDLTQVRKAVAAWPEEGADEPASRLRRRMWEAVLLDADGDRRAGADLMAEVVADAELDGHLQLFLDGGRDAARILKRLYHDAPTPYLRRVADVVAEGPAANWSPGLVEQLSERELAVLRYLPSRLSNPEIASKLYVSVNTVKTHVKAVYRKLGVTSRTEAVERAEELGLV